MGFFTGERDVQESEEVAVMQKLTLLMSVNVVAEKESIRTSMIFPRGGVGVGIAAIGKEASKNHPGPLTRKNPGVVQPPHPGSRS